MFGRHMYFVNSVKPEIENFTVTLRCVVVYKYSKRLASYQSFGAMLRCQFENITST